jgi:hypothetical protein
MIYFMVFMELTSPRKEAHASGDAAGVHKLRPYRGFDEGRNPPVPPDSTFS